MSLGSTLRNAREAHGITTSELAARTHMLVQIVEGLENEDFRRIPAPIYGRGFIKLYCEAVNLDPKPLQAEFMDLFNRAKDAPEKVDMPRPARRATTPPPTPPPVEAPLPEPEAAAPQPIPEATMQPEPAASPQPVHEEFAQDFSQPVRQTDAPAAHEPPAVNDLGDLFAAAAGQENQLPPVQPTPSQQPPKRSYEDLFGHAYADENNEPKPSAAEKFRNTMSNVSSGVFANVHKLPRNTGRLIMVGIVAILLICGMWWGISALYKATSPAKGESTSMTQEPPAEAPVSKPTAEEKKPDAKDSRLSSKATDADVKKPESSEKEPKASRKSSSGPSATPVKPGDLKSSGIEVPALYID